MVVINNTMTRIEAEARANMWADELQLLREHAAETFHRRAAEIFNQLMDEGDLEISLRTAYFFLSTAELPLDAEKLGATFDRWHQFCGREISLAWSSETPNRLIEGRNFTPDNIREWLSPKDPYVRTETARC